MSEKSTRSTIDFSHIKIDKLQYNQPPRLQTNRSMSESQAPNILSQNQSQFTEVKLDKDVTTVGGHELNDQPTRSQPSHQNFIKEELQIFQKFTGTGDAEQWLTCLLEKFDLLGVDMAERIKWIPNVLTSEGFMWYAQYEKFMPTFIAFTNLFLQRFSTKRTEDEKITPNNQFLHQQQLTITNGIQDDVFCSLRNQLLLVTLKNYQNLQGEQNKMFQNGYVKSIKQCIC